MPLEVKIIQPTSTQTEKALSSEASRPSGKLMWHIATGDFDDSKYTSRVTQQALKDVSPTSYDALEAQHDRVRKKDSESRQQLLKEFHERLRADGKNEDEIKKQIHHVEMGQWSRKQSLRLESFIENAQDKQSMLQALNKLGFAVTMDTRDANLLQDALYKLSGDGKSGEYGDFYKTFCLNGVKTNEALVTILTSEEMDAIQPFLVDVLGGQTAFQAIKALRQTQDMLQANQNTAANQISEFGKQPSLKPGEEETLNFFKNGAAMVAKKAQTPQAPETQSPTTRPLTDAEKQIQEEVEGKRQEQLRELVTTLKYNGISRTVLQKESQVLGLDKDIVTVLLTTYPTLLTDIPDGEFKVERRQKNYRLLSGEEEGQGSNANIQRLRTEISQAISRVVIRSLEESFINSYEQGQLPYASLADAAKAGFLNFEQKVGKGVFVSQNIAELKQQAVKIGNQLVRADLGHELLIQLMNDLDIDDEETKSSSSPIEQTTSAELTTQVVDDFIRSVNARGEQNQSALDKVRAQLESSSLTGALLQSDLDKLLNTNNNYSQAFFLSKEQEIAIQSLSKDLRPFDLGTIDKAPDPIPQELEKRIRETLAPILQRKNFTTLVEQAQSLLETPLLDAQIKRVESALTSFPAGRALQAVIENKREMPDIHNIYLLQLAIEAAQISNHAPAGLQAIVPLSEEDLVAIGQAVYKDAGKIKEVKQMYQDLQEKQRMEIEQERQEVERKNAILANTPDEILLPDTPRFAHRTNSAEKVLGIFNNGLWIRNYTGLSSTASGLWMKNARGNNAEVKEHNAERLAAKHSPGYRQSTFAVIIAFPNKMPDSVQKAYDQMDSEDKRDNFRAYLNWNVSDSDKEKGVLATLSPQYIIGVVNQDTGQYYTKEEFLRTFNQS